jgi:hypothetical protein
MYLQCYTLTFKFNYPKGPIVIHLNIENVMTMNTLLTIAIAIYDEINVGEMTLNGKLYNFNKHVYICYV